MRCIARVDVGVCDVIWSVMRCGAADSVRSGAPVLALLNRDARCERMIRKKADVLS